MPMTALTHCPSASPLMILHQTELRRHVDQCRAGRSRWFHAAVHMERLHCALAPRFLTTVAAATGLLLLTSIWP